MNWEAIGAIGEIAGALAVVLTLFYLAKQIRNNSTQLEVGSITEINALFNDAVLPIYNTEINMSIWVNGLASSEALNEQESEVFDMLMIRVLNPFETVVAHYLKGTLHEDTLLRYVAYINNSVLSSPGGQAWLESKSALLSEEALRYLSVKEGT